MIQLLQPECLEDLDITASSADVKITLTNGTGDSYVLVLERDEILDYVADRLMYYKLADQITKEDIAPF